MCGFSLAHSPWPVFWVDSLWTTAALRATLGQGWSDCQGRIGLHSELWSVCEPPRGIFQWWFMGRLSAGVVRQSVGAPFLKCHLIFVSACFSKSFFWPVMEVSPLTRLTSGQYSGCCGRRIGLYSSISNKRVIRDSLIIFLFPHGRGCCGLVQPCPVLPWGGNGASKPPVPYSVCPDLWFLLEQRPELFPWEGWASTKSLLDMSVHPGQHTSWFSPARTERCCGLFISSCFFCSLHWVWCLCLLPNALMGELPPGFFWHMVLIPITPTEILLFVDWCLISRLGGNKRRDVLCCHDADVTPLT